LNHSHSEQLKFFMEIQDRVMLSILLAKFLPHGACRNYLMSTGDKILVEANGKDSKWGMGQTKGEILAEIAQVGPSWSPPPGKNLLGRLLMQIRSYIRSGTPLGDPTLVVSDSILKDVVLPARTIIRPGANLQTAFTILKMTVTPTTQLVIFHAGTNNIPKWKPSNPRYSKDLDARDGGIKIRRASQILEIFSRKYKEFRKLFSERSGYQNITFAWSEILFRHCNPPALRKCKAFGPGRRRSRAQMAGIRINAAIGKRSVTDGSLRVIRHSKFLNPRLFRDGLHPNDSGRGVIREKLRRFIDTYYGRET
jgi:hypothetical protein